MMKRAGNWLHAIWDSIEEFEDAKEWMVANEYGGWPTYEARRPDYGWFAEEAISYAEATKRVRDGDHGVWQKLRTYADRIQGQYLNTDTTRIQVRRRKRVASDHGDVLHITKVWNGQLDKAWDRPVRRSHMSVSERYATIFIDVGANASIDAHQCYWRGAAALIMNDILVRSGRNVEIYVGESRTDHSFGLVGPAHYSWAMRVKGFREVLSEERLAAMVTMTYFRTYGFKAIAAAPFRISSTFGRAVRVNHLPGLLQERADSGQLIGMINHCFTQDEALEALNTIVAQLQRAEAA